MPTIPTSPKHHLPPLAPAGTDALPYILIPFRCGARNDGKDSQASRTSDLAMDDWLTVNTYRSHLGRGVGQLGRIKKNLVPESGTHT